MVYSRRKSPGDIIQDQDIFRMRSDNLRPSHEIWKTSVPPWEKQFCSTVGSIPWRKFLEMKNYTHLYENVVKWNDSAGEEAFNDAKTRFWAKIKGLPCDISLPDPDIYIDCVDWDSGVDPELLLDLESEPKVSADLDQDENAVPLTQALLTSQSFSCTGWGESEEYFQNVKRSSDPWECNVEQRGRGFDPLPSSFDGSRRDDASRWQSWGANGARNNVTGWYDSRYKASRFPRNDYQSDRAYRERRKMVNFAHEKHCLRQWAMKS